MPQTVAVTNIDTRVRSVRNDMNALGDSLRSDRKESRIAIKSNWTRRERIMRKLLAEQKQCELAYLLLGTDLDCLSLRAIPN